MIPKQEDDFPQIFLLVQIKPDCTDILSALNRLGFVQYNLVTVVDSLEKQYKMHFTGQGYDGVRLTSMPFKFTSELCYNCLQMV